MFRFAFIFFIWNSFVFTPCKSYPMVYTSLGLIAGTIETSRNGTEFYSFRGIPYAKATRGQLRFKPPVPEKHWTGIYEGFMEGPSCESDLLEDCLRLNVYTRRINEVRVTRPVLVFIHGGYFRFFSARSYVFGPDYLMDHDIVLVTINYRLGTLGFFSTGDKYAPGNYGLKDQVEALKWVQNNIEFFGGDPTKVTISGENAGAASVGLHLVSPMSKGLFHGAIMLSGSAINPWAVDKNPMKLAKKQADLLDCPTNSSEELVQCLREVPEEKMELLFQRLYEWSYEGPALSPVIETEETDEERFLDKDPLISLLNGDIADVPVFVGTTAYEGLSRAHYILENETLAEELSQNWTSILPVICLFEPNDAISERLREFYLGDSNQCLTNKSLEGLSNLFSDALTVYAVSQSAKLISGKNSKPVYLYQYNYSGKGLHDYLRKGNKPVGIANALQVFYIFYSRVYFPTNFKVNSEDGKIVTKLTTLWKNFVETGNPTPVPSEVLDNVIWEPYTKENPKYLDVEEKLGMETGMYFEERMKLWEDLFPLPGKN